MPAAERRPVPAILLPLMTLGVILGILLARKADMTLLPPALIALACSLAAALLLPGRGRMAALTLLCCALGVLTTLHAGNPALPPEDEYVVTGIVMEEPMPDPDAETLRTCLSSVTLNGEPLQGYALWTSHPDEGEALPSWLIPGTRVSFTSRAYHPRSAANPGGYDTREAWLADGVILGVYGHDGLRRADEPSGLQGFAPRLRHVITAGLLRVMGREGGAFAAATLLGEKNYLHDADYTAFRRLGLLHVMSVSGYHVGILALLLLKLLRCFHLRRGISSILLGALLTLYALLAGAAAPVIRAGLLVMLHEVGHLRNRQAVSAHLIWLTAMLQLLLSPFQLFSASFQLTYGAMLGLLLVYPRLRRVFRSRRTWKSTLWDGLSVSLAVQLGLLPAQMHFFGAVTPAALLTNLLIVSVITLLMGSYWLMLILLPVPLVREALGFLLGRTTEGLLAILRGLSALLGGHVRTPAADALTFVGWVLMMLGLSVLLRPERRRLRRSLSLAGAVLIVLSLARLPHTETCYIQFSDGEADAAILHDRNAVILIDTGEYAHTLTGYLQRDALAVDMLILTHLHTDHAGGIRGLLDAGVPVRVCALPEGALLAADTDAEALALLAELEATGTRLVTLSRGDVIHTPTGQLTVLWPQAGTVRPGLSANEYALVLRADIQGTTLLLTGDVTSRYEMYAAVPADVLKAAHHGSQESTSPGFLEAVSPQLILLSCGEESRENGLSARVGEIPVYSTRTGGAITLRFTQDAFTVETYLPR